MYNETAIEITRRNSLAVQRLGLHTSTAKGLGSIPGGELRSHKLQGMPPPKNK